MATHLQAIVTRYFGPGNVRGSRIKATAAAGSITLPYDCSLSITANHARAAKALADKFKWRGVWFGGGHPSDSGSVFVCVAAAPHTSLSFNSEFITEGEH